MTTLYGIKNCDTMKKTQKWLQANGVEFEFVDYKKSPPDAELIQKFLGQHGLDVLINKRGTTWRKLDDATKENLDTDSAIALMCEQPSIIKRPIIEANDGTLLVGYNEDAFQPLL